MVLKVEPKEKVLERRTLETKTDNVKVIQQNEEMVIVERVLLWSPQVD